MTIHMEMERVTDSTGREYNLFNGTCYHVDTPAEVVQVLAYLQRNRIRVKIHFGDTVTGRDWNEEHDVEGYIGRSTGRFKIPLLVYNDRSYGGGALLDHCIVKIAYSSGGGIVYQHPLYIPSVFEIVPSDLPEYSHNVNIDGELYARCHSEREAKNLVKRMQK